MVEFILAGTSERVQGNISMLVGMCMFVGLNYFGQRLIVFKRSEGSVSYESKKIIGKH